MDENISIPNEVEIKDEAEKLAYFLYDLYIESKQKLDSDSKM